MYPRSHRGYRVSCIMSAGHVFSRPTVFIVILVFTLLLGSTSDDAHYNLNRCTVVRRFSSLSQQGKLPILKWSKRGQTTIAMLDNQCFVAVDVILLCGRRSPTTWAHRSSRKRQQRNYNSSRQITYLSPLGK